MSALLQNKQTFSIYEADSFKEKVIDVPLKFHSRVIMPEEDILLEIRDPIYTALVNSSELPWSPPAKNIQTPNSLSEIISNPFDQILSLIPCAVFWKDLKGIFHGCNQRFLEFAGIKDKNLIIGKHDKELSWANRWEEYYRDDQQVIANRKPLVLIEEVALVHKKITAHTTKVTWYKEGKPFGIIGVINDITEFAEAKKQAELANKAKTEFLRNYEKEIRTIILPNHWKA